MSYRIQDYLSDSSQVILCSNLVLITSLIKQIFELSGAMIFGLILFQAFLLGALYNGVFMVMSSRFKPEYIGISYEISNCFGQFVGQLSPFVSTMAEPRPTIFNVVMCVMISVVMFFTPKKKEDYKEQSQIVSFLENSFGPTMHHDNPNANWKQLISAMSDLSVDSPSKLNKSQDKESDDYKILQ